MSIITGLAAEAYADFKDDFEAGALHVPGGKTSDGRGGHTFGDPDDYPCKVLLINATERRRRDLGIPESSRVCLMLAGSVSVLPEKGHTITAPDPLKGLAPSTLEVVTRHTDPAGALFILELK